MNRVGWIKLSRSLLDWRWFHDGNTLKVWLFLLLRANIEPSVFKNVPLARGQLATSYKSIAAQTGMTYDQARTAIAHLKDTGEITVLRRSNFLVISIGKYDLYQHCFPDLNPRESQQIKKKEYLKGVISPLWEDDLDVPGRFRGRFPDAESYLKFIEREG